MLTSGVLDGLNGLLPMCLSPAILSVHLGCAASRSTGPRSHDACATCGTADLSYCSEPAHAHTLGFEFPSTNKPLGLHAGAW